MKKTFEKYKISKLFHRYFIQVFLIIIAVLLIVNLIESQGLFMELKLVKTKPSPIPTLAPTFVPSPAPTTTSTPTSTLIPIRIATPTLTPTLTVNPLIQNRINEIDKQIARLREAIQIGINAGKNSNCGTIECIAILNQIYATNNSAMQQIQQLEAEKTQLQLQLPH